MKFSKATYRFVFFLLFLTGLWVFGQMFHVDIDKIHAWLAQFPLWLSGFLYVLIYVAVTTFIWFGTIDFFRITGALLFGPFWSTLFVYIAEICNASILFLISRKLGRQFIEERFNFKDKERKYTPETATFWTALALRINPLVPFRFMDVGFGLSKISFKGYFWAVVFGSPLRILWLQYVIAGMGEGILKNPMMMMEYFQTNRLAFMISSLYLGGVFLITIIAIIVNLFRKKLIRSPSP